jgi:predicted O-methyltransferase YrrM
MTDAVVDERTIARWYDGKDCSCDWTSGNIPVWARLLAARRKEPLRVLEIGSWEGRSALFFLNFLPAAHVVCVDTFGGSVEHHQDEHFASLVPATEGRFDANVLAAFGSRVEKIKGASGTALPQLAIGGRRFDVVYIDGSHFAADVYSDAALVWPMVDSGGIVIFDDYEWDLMNTESERPKLGVNAFLAGIKGGYRLLHSDYQLAIERLPIC